MSNDVSQNYAPEIVGGAVEVAGHLLGRSLVDYLRRNFTTGSQVQRGDDYMDRSRDLLQKHLQLIELREQDLIRRRYLQAQHSREGLDDDQNSSLVQRHLQARKYKRYCRRAFKIIKRASDRAIDNRLMDQIADATRGPEPAGHGNNNPGTSTVASTPRNPFTDSHAISELTDVSVNDLDRVEMSTFQNETTNEAAVILELHSQDASVQHIVATFPNELFSGKRTDGEASQPVAPEATTALSLHQDDGSSPRLVTTSLPPGEWAAVEAETHTISTVDPAELFGHS